jgi:hypothetical protein
VRRIAILLACLAPALGGGCLNTCHVENHREVYTGVDTSGAVTHADNAVHNERSWLGPWLGLPSQAIP